MDGEPGGEDLQRGLAPIQVGELCSGMVTAVSQSGQLEVALDGFPALIGMIGSRDQGWPPACEGGGEAR